MRLRRSQRAESGQAMVEFALVVPILLTIVFATIEFGTAFWHYQQLSAAASEGARYGVVNRNNPNRVNDITTRVKAAAPNLRSGDIIVDVQSSWNSGDTLTVTATYPEKVDVMGFTFFNDNLRSTRTMRVEQ